MTEPRGLLTHQKNSTLTLGVGVGVLALVLCALGMWSSFRGLDVSDEAFYWLNFQFPRETYVLSAFGAILHLLYGWLSPGVVALRILEIAQSLIAGCFLARELQRWMESRGLLFDRPRRWALLGWILIGALLPSVFGGPRGLSYNQLNQDLFMLLTALLFRSMRLGVSGKSTDITFLGMGVVLGLAFLTKFSSAVLMAAMAALLSLFSVKSVRSGARAAGLAVLGFALSFHVVLWGALGFSYSEYVTRFREDYQAISMMGHSSSDLIREYLGTIKGLIFSSIKYVGLGAVMCLGSRRMPAVGTWLHAACGAVLIGILLRTSDGTAGDGTVIPVLRALSVWLGIWAVSRVHERSLKKPEVAILLYCLAVPIIGALGTNNPLVHQMAYHLDHLFVALALLFWSVERDRLLSIGTWAGTVVLLILCGIVTQRSWKFTVESPYRIPTPLTEQREKVVGIPSFKGLRVDAVNRDFFESIHRLVEASGLKRPLPVLVFHNGPALVMAAGGYGPGFPWISTGGARSEGMCQFLSRGGAEVLRRSLVFVIQSEVDPILRDCLGRLGVDLTRDFVASPPLKSAYRKLDYVKVLLPIAR